MVFIVLQCFAAPQYSKRIVGFRLGLQGLYKAAALIATEGFTGEIGFRGDVGHVSGQGGLATSMGLQNRLTKAVADRNAIRPNGWVVRLFYLERLPNLTIKFT